MKKFLRKILFPAAVISTALLITACSQNADTSDSKTDPNPSKKKPDPLHISVFTLQDEEQPSESNKTYKWIKDNFGVTFEWDILSQSTNKDGYIQSLIASGDLPDLVEVDSPVFQEAGTLRDLKPLIEKYCPNLKKHYASAWNKMIFIDGEKDASGNIIKEHIYSLPNYGVLDGSEINGTYNGTAWWIQKDVLREFKYPVIKTIDQYFDLIEAYYRKYPVIDGTLIIPFSIITDDWEAFNLYNASGFLAGYPNDGYGHVNNNTYAASFADASTKRWLKLANGYFQRGLIDPASFTDNRNQYYNKIADGRVLGMFIQGWEFQDDADLYLPDERKYVPLALTFDETIPTHYRNQTLPNLQKGYGITVRCPQDKAIKILQFIDEMLEEENQKILYWGFEGIDYTLDAGKPVQTRQQYLDWLSYTKAVLWANEAPKLEGLLSSGYCNYISEMPHNYEKSLSSLDKELLSHYGFNSYAEFFEPEPSENPVWFPMWQCYPVEGDAKVSMDVCEGLMKKYFPGLIMGKTAAFDTTWEEFEKNINNAKSPFESYMQKQLNQRINAFGRN